MGEITPLSHGMRPEAAKRRVEAFRKHFGDAHLYLAYHAAFPLALTPDLLYRLRTNFQRDIHGQNLNIPWIAVADLLLSSLCSEIGYELYEMDVAVRAELLSQLKVHPDFGPLRISDLSNFLLKYVQQQLDSHDHDIRDFAQAQYWTALAATDPKKAAQSIALTLSRLDLRDRTEFARLGSLIETFTESSAELTELLAYIRGMELYARGDNESAEVELSKVARSGQSPQITGVDLSIPEQLRKETEKEPKQQLTRRRNFLGMFENKNIICPFCFQEFSPQEMRLRCENPVCQGKTADTIFANTRNYALTIMGRVLAPGKKKFRNGLPYQVRCDVCDAVSNTFLCPSCHFQLPYDIGQIDQKIIAIIGGRASGKSHYIASLVNRLERVVANSFHMSMQKVGNETEERWVRDFYTPLFVKKTVLQPNRPANIDPQVRIPLIFRLIIKKGGHTRSLNLSFFDTAGEDMTSSNIMAVHNRYILHADGIIFLLDPLQIPPVQQKLGLSKMPALDPRYAPMNIVGQLRELFERERAVRVNQKVRIPIAFTLSKIDALESLLVPDSQLTGPSESEAYGYLDLGEVQSVSTEVANYLRTWIGPSFSLTIEHNFQSYKFFAMSSLGHIPLQNNQLVTVSPHRVEDPFLWLLYKLGLIEGRY